MLLQLLVDDNADIRRDASKLIYKLKLCNELECIEKTWSVFFQSFSEMVADKYPAIALSALFCWSVSLLGDADYEMDETDVSLFVIFVIYNIYNIRVFINRYLTNVGITMSSNR